MVLLKDVSDKCRLLIRWSGVQISPDPPALLSLASAGLFYFLKLSLSELASVHKSVGRKRLLVYDEANNR